MTDPEARKIGYTAEGRRIGETHHGAKHPDALVNAIRDLHEQHGYGWRRVTRMLNEDGKWGHLSARWVRKVMFYELRIGCVAYWRNEPAHPNAQPPSRHG